MPSSRDSEFGGLPLEPLLCSEAEFDAREVLNGIVLAQYTTELAYEWQGVYRFTPEIVRRCNRIAMSEIYACAGEYRTRCVTAGDFVGANHRDVPRLVEEMCDHVNSTQADVFRSAAYILWRTNWIHPFYDGNGRVSRELSYLAIVAGFGMTELEGATPIPGLLKQYEDRYMQCLRVADTLRPDDDAPNLGPLESLLSELLIEQMNS